MSSEVIQDSYLGNLFPPSTLAHNASCGPDSATRPKEPEDMIGISFIGILIALAVLAIAAFFLVLKLGVGKRQRPEQWEKAAIMKQLLDLSERETSRATTRPSMRLHAPASAPGMRPSNAHLKATAKTVLPVRSNART